MHEKLEIEKEKEREREVTKWVKPSRIKGCIIDEELLSS